MPLFSVYGTCTHNQVRPLKEFFADCSFSLFTYTKGLNGYVDKGKSRQSKHFYLGMTVEEKKRKRKDPQLYVFHKLYFK